MTQPIHNVSDVVREMNREYGYDEPDGTRGIFAHDAANATPFDEALTKKIATLLTSIVKRIEATKEAVQRDTGSYKYDSCYDDCITIIKSSME